MYIYLFSVSVVQGWDILVNRLSLRQVVLGLLSVLVTELARLL